MAKVRAMMEASVGESQVINSLKEEISRQKALIEGRDKRVNELLEAEKISRKHKEEIVKDLESIRQERDARTNEVQMKDAQMREQAALIGQ